MKKKDNNNMLFIFDRTALAVRLWQSFFRFKDRCDGWIGKQ